MDRPPPSPPLPAFARDLRGLGLVHTGLVHAGLSPARLTELAVGRGEALLTDRGALAAYTGSRTGRSPKDRFIVARPPSREQVWWGPVNRPMEPDVFERLLAKVGA